LFARFLRLYFEWMFTDDLRKLACERRRLSSQYARRQSRAASGFPLRRDNRPKSRLVDEHALLVGAEHDVAHPDAHGGSRHAEVLLDLLD
jgi:hypothetical protein